MLPGETGTYDWGFIVPDESQDHVVLKITVDPPTCQSSLLGSDQANIELVSLPGLGPNW